MALVAIIPCLNEEVSIAKTIEKIKAVKKHSTVIVIDNGSSDKTVEEAIKAGAKVLHEPKKGKGYAIRRGLNSLPKDTDAVFNATVFLDCVNQDLIEIGRGVPGMEKVVAFAEASRAALRTSSAMPVANASSFAIFPLKVVYDSRVAPTMPPIPPPEA